MEKPEEAHKVEKPENAREVDKLEEAREMIKDRQLYGPRFSDDVD